MGEIVVSAKAPGKIVLSGEHSVVYGKPAIALAVDRFATTTIIKEPGYGIWFEFLNERLKQVVSLQELHELKTKVLKRYRKFLVGKYKIRDVILDPIEFVQYAFIYLVDNLFLHIKDGLKIQIELSIPVGSGMGASAALIISLIHALANYFNHELTFDKYLYFGREIENLRHGRSSGLDLFLSLHGGCHFFVNGVANKRNIPVFPFILINTGRPRSSTGECVEHVAKNMQSGSLLDDFASIAIGMDRALQKNDLDDLRQWVRKSNELLNSIGVVPKKVADFIAEIERSGLAAKVSGAGTIEGKNAGIVLIVGEGDISDLVRKYDYEILSVNEEYNGVRLV